VAAAAASLTLPAGAFGHAGVKSRSPKPNSSVSAPRAVTVTFEEAVLDANLSVAEAGGGKVATGPRTMLRRKTRVRVRLSPKLSPGTYRATVNFLADDGHKQSSSWTFRVR
jgi:copper resistance protein C